MAVILISTWSKSAFNKNEHAEDTTKIEHRPYLRQIFLSLYNTIPNNKHCH